MVAPAGVVAPGKLDLALGALRRVGFRVEVDRQVYQTCVDAPFLAGSDTARARALEAAFADTSVDAVLCARGGYGAMRILPLLDASIFAANPKALVGFSDITALCGFLACRAGIASLHGPLLSTVALHKERGTEKDESFSHLVDSLLGSAPSTRLSNLRCVQPGQAYGVLLGGNLSLVASLVETPWFPSLRGSILFLEEVGESAYRVDRLLTTLALRGSLAEVQGVVIGDTGTAGDRYLAGDKLEAFVEHRLRTLLGGRPIPVAMGGEFGHGSTNATLPFGRPATLTCTAEGAVLEVSSATS